MRRGGWGSGDFVGGRATRQRHAYQVLALVSLTGVVLLVLAAWVRGEPWPGPAVPWEKAALAAEFAIVFLGMLLFSERTWKHHCVTLILPFAVLSYFLATCLNSKTNYTLPAFTIVVATLLMTLTSTGLLEDDFAKEAQVYGCYVWAFILMMVCLFIVLYRNNNKTLVTSNSI